MVSVPHQYQCVSLSLHSIIIILSYYFLCIYPCLCVYCVPRKTQRIAETKHFLCAAYSTFKQLIYAHPTVQLCCTESLKLHFFLMKMHQRLVHWNLIFHMKCFDRDPVTKFPRDGCLKSLHFEDSRHSIEAPQSPWLFCIFPSVVFLKSNI